VTARGRPVSGESLTESQRTLLVEGFDWSGYDGCNTTYGSIRLSDDGSFSTWGDS
jgi:hypothetical protein